MVKATLYPGADRSKWLPRFGGITMPKISKLVLHSTESKGLPSYPTFAPQFTFDPWRLKWWQHMPANLSASTLADPSSTAVRENRDDVVQVEIIGYADPKQAAAYQVNKMPANAIAELGRFVAWLHTEWGLPLAAVPKAKWLAYPASYGTAGGARMSGSAYDAFTGVLGHQHVSGNSHGDPGNINIAGIMAAADLVLNPPKPTPPPAPARPVHQLLNLNCQWPGFTSTKGEPWSTRRPLLAQIIVRSKATIVAATELGELEARELAADLAAAEPGAGWRYQRYGLNTILWKDWTQAGATLEWPLPSYGQKARTAIAVKLVKGADYVWVVCTHFASDSADLTTTHIKAQGGQAKALDAQLRADQPGGFRQFILAGDIQDEETPGWPRPILAAHGLTFANRGTVMAIAAGARVKVQTVTTIPTGVATDHDGQLATFTTTKEN